MAASAKFLEEALTTDVDESAVNAIVGSLETQLAVPSAPQTPQVTLNGSTVPTVTTSNGPASSTSASAMTTSSPSATTPNCVVVAPPPLAHVNSQLVNTTQQKVNQVKPTPSASPTPQLVQANGLGAAATTTTSTSTPNNNNQASVTSTLNKLVIKSNTTATNLPPPPQPPPPPSSSSTSSPQQNNTVQILNVNAMRPNTPVTLQHQQQAAAAKQQVASRVVTINQTMVGARAGTGPGITLQTLQGLTQNSGQLLVKTENGQFHLLRVQPGTAAGAVTANSITGNTVQLAQAGTTFRLALPGVSRLNATQFTGPPLATIRKPVQTVAPTVTTTTVTPVTSTIVSATTTTPAPTPAVVQSTPAAAQVKRPTTDNTKEKCRKFLANLLELSSREPKHVEKNVRTLIQELINVEVEPEVFCVRLEKLLNASPQPCLIGFLKKSLPLLRQSLVKNEMVIDGIRPPPPDKVFTIETSLNQSQNRTAGTVCAVPSQVVAAAPGQQLQAATPGTQVRVMAPMAGVTNVPRPPQQQTIVQQRPIQRPVTVSRPAGGKTYAIKAGQGPVQLQQPLLQPPTPQQLQLQLQHQQQSMVVTNAAGQQIRHAIQPGQLVVPAQGKNLPNTATKSSNLQNKLVNAMQLNKTAASAVPSVVNKSSAGLKEKEKKTFSSAGYAGDDDINDVAAMGGVNLAEESQRILGSTKFVGTQIRSCKDEPFVHMTPLQQKINSIASSNGLEEPSQEVLLLISHAVQERLKNFVEKLSIIAEHRIDFQKNDPRYEVTQDVRAQLKFLEELDKVERKRHEEQERETLMKVAKSRAKTEDPEQAKLKAKAKEMQRAEMEEARQREANQTALQAIGPRKKPKLDSGEPGSNASSTAAASANAVGGLMSRPMSIRPRIKRVTLRDLQFVLEQEKDTCRGIRLYKSYL